MQIVNSRMCHSSEQYEGRAHAERSCLPVLYATRGSAALGDFLVLAVTVGQTAQQLLMAKRTGIRLNLSYILLRDGGSNKFLHIFPSKASSTTCPGALYFL